MDNITKKILYLKYNWEIDKLNFPKSKLYWYSFLINLPIIKWTSLLNELVEVDNENCNKSIDKEVLFINLEPSDQNYNHFLRNCFVDFFNDKNIVNDIISYENKVNLKKNLSSFYKDSKNNYWTTYFFSSIFTDKVFEAICVLLESNNYKKVIFHWRGYLLCKLLVSEFFDKIKDKLTVVMSHWLDILADARDIDIKEDEYNQKLSKVKKVYFPWDIFYTFPNYLSINNVKKYDSKFRIFIWWKSNRNLQLIKSVIEKLNEMSDSFEFVVTSDDDFSNSDNIKIYKYLQFEKFIGFLRNSNVNLVLNENLGKNSWDSTLMYWFAFWIPWITNTKNKYSRLYIKDGYNGFIINNNSIDEIVKKVMFLKENINEYNLIVKNSIDFFDNYLTTELLVDKIYHNL